VLPERRGRAPRRKLTESLWPNRGADALGPTRAVPWLGPQAERRAPSRACYYIAPVRIGSLYEVGLPP
jgi:hypothetical protein